MNGWNKFIIEYNNWFSCFSMIIYIYTYIYIYEREREREREREKERKSGRSLTILHIVEIWLFWGMEYSDNCSFIQMVELEIKKTVFFDNTLVYIGHPYFIAIIHWFLKFTKWY